MKLDNSEMREESGLKALKNLLQMIISDHAFPGKKEEAMDDDLQEKEAPAAPAKKPSPSGRGFSMSKLAGLSTRGKEPKKPAVPVKKSKKGF